MIIHQLDRSHRHVWNQTKRNPGSSLHRKNLYH